ncbi:MAG: hypothetical protein OEO21_07115 [Candidatus Krumholzibacteria bacterium]|nr:hypothetical protein [Candidatus Krumholzibacteria bacterium]
MSLDVRASWVDFGDANTSIIPLEATGRAKLGMFYGGLGSASSSTRYSRRTSARRSWTRAAWV